jgi:hypothetical protein
LHGLAGGSDEACRRVWAVKRRQYAVVLIDHTGRWQVRDPHFFRRRGIDIDIDLHWLETGRDDGDRLRIGERLFVERNTGVAPRGTEHHQHGASADDSGGLCLFQRRMPGNGCLCHRRPTRRRQKGNQSDGNDAAGGVESQTAHGDVAPRARTVENHEYG